MEVERVVACGVVEVGGLVCAWAHYGLSPVRRPFLYVLRCKRINLARA